MPFTTCTKMLFTTTTIFAAMSLLPTSSFAEDINGWNTQLKYCREEHSLTGICHSGPNGGDCNGASYTMQCTCLNINCRRWAPYYTESDSSITFYGLNNGDNKMCADPSARIVAMCASRAGQQTCTHPGNGELYEVVFGCLKHEEGMTTVGTGQTLSNIATGGSVTECTQQGDLYESYEDPRMIKRIMINTDGSFEAECMKTNEGNDFDG